MLCVEEICSMFKNLVPHKRIELMCALLQCCVPLELRFIGSYLENLGKRDFHYLRQYEIKSNSDAEIRTLFKANEDVIRNKLAIYLSLLHTSNNVCSKLCYDLLMLLHTYLIRAYASPLTYSKLTLDVMLELLTVLVMGINHPAFTFEQRSRLFEIYRWLESRAECLLPVSMDKQVMESSPVDPRSVDVQLSDSPPNPVEEHAEFTRNTPVESVPCPAYNKIVTPGKTDRDTHLHIGEVPIFLEPLGNPFFDCPEDPLLTSPLEVCLQSPLEPAPSPVLSPENSSLSHQSWPRPRLGNSPSQAEHRQFFQDSPQKVFIKRVEVTGSRKPDRKQEFQMEVTWSNGETSEVFKSYQELYDFHARLVQFYPEDASVHRQDRKLPFLSGNPHLSSREDYLQLTSNTISDYFRKLVSLENDILGCDIVLAFLHENDSISPASSLSSSSRQSHYTSPTCSNPQQDEDFATENCSSNSIIITRASPLRDVTNSSSDYSPEKPSLVRRSPSPNHRQNLPITQQLSEPSKDSRSQSPKNADTVKARQDNQSPSPKHPVQELLKPPPGSRSLSPKHNDSLPTIEELLDELQLSHHKDTFNQFTMIQLMNFQEEDFVLLKLSSHAQKRLKTKLKQLGRGKLLNGFRSDFSEPSFDLTQAQLPPDTLYTSTVSLGQLTSSDNGNSSRDSSPPVSPRQVKNMHSHDRQATGPTSPCHSPIPHGTGRVSPHHLGISQGTGRVSPHQVNRTQITTCNMQDTEPLSPMHAKTQQLGHLEVEEPVSQVHDKINQMSSFPCTDHISSQPVNVLSSGLPCMSSGLPCMNSGFPCVSSGFPFKSENREESADPEFQSSPEYATNERMKQPHSDRAPAPNIGVQPSTERLQPPEDRLNTPEGCPQLVSNPFQGPIQEPLSAVSLSGPTLEPVTGQIDRIPPDLVPNQTSQSEEPCDRPQNNKPIEFSSHIYHTGFMPDHAVAYHVPRPNMNYPRLYPPMYPVCAPQPAHLPRHMYNNLPLTGEHQMHSKKPLGKPYFQTHTDPITNKVMTVTVNSAAYRPQFTDCPPSSSPITPVTSHANLARSMSIVNPPGASPRFAFPSTIAPPMTYSNVNPAQIHHMKQVNGQPSNRDPSTTSQENVTFGGPQHVSTTVGDTPQYSPSPAHVVNFHSSCTSCGCRGRCGASPNYSPAYGGYVHHQVSMPPVVHLPAFMSSNSNGLHPSPCLPPNCQLPFAMNPLPNGITPEQISVHSYLSQASSQAPNLLNRMFYGYHSHNSAGTERDPKAKPPTCYNCGESGHEATDCKEATMESNSGQYWLNFKPDSFD